jgi:hypothetical protein
MKLLIRNIAGFICLTGVLFACTKPQDNTNVNNNTNTNTIAGTWKVSLFTEPTENKTNDFAGYTFNFNTGGKLMVSKSGVTKEGTWSVSNNRFTIDLGAKSSTNKPLGELTDDWVIVIKNDTKISLKDDNVTKNEVLEFSKN